MRELPTWHRVWVESRRRVIRTLAASRKSGPARNLMSEVTCAAYLIGYVPKNDRIKGNRPSASGPRSREPSPPDVHAKFMLSMCVSATVHTPVRRGSCTGSDAGLTWGMATLNRVSVSAACGVCVAPVASMHENEASVNVYEVLPSTFLRLRCTWWCVVNDLRLRCTCTCWCAVNAVYVWCVIRNERPGGAKRMDVIIGGPGIPELVVHVRRSGVLVSNYNHRGC